MSCVTTTINIGLLSSVGLLGLHFTTWKRQDTMISCKNGNWICTMYNASIYTCWNLKKSKVVGWSNDVGISHGMICCTHQPLLFSLYILMSQLYWILIQLWKMYEHKRGTISPHLYLYSTIFYNLFYHKVKSCHTHQGSHKIKSPSL